MSGCALSIFGQKKSGRLVDPTQTARGAEALAHGLGLVLRALTDPRHNVFSGARGAGFDRDIVDLFF